MSDEKTATTRKLLEHYYVAFSKKEDWTAVIADDFEFRSGDMTEQTPVTGKQGYIAVIDRFSRVYTEMRVKSMVVEGENACVIGNYDYRFPNGKVLNGDVAEIWTAKNGKLQSLTIFFDTLTFFRNTPQ